jgi:hypothetical protein
MELVCLPETAIGAHALPDDVLKDQSPPVPGVSPLPIMGQRVASVALNQSEIEHIVSCYSTAQTQILLLESQLIKACRQVHLLEAGSTELRDKLRELEKGNPKARCDGEFRRTRRIANDTLPRRARKVRRKSAPRQLSDHSNNKLVKIRNRLPSSDTKCGSIHSSRNELKNGSQGLDDAAREEGSKETLPSIMAEKEAEDTRNLMADIRRLESEKEHLAEVCRNKEKSLAGPFNITAASSR